MIDICFGVHACIDQFQLMVILMSNDCTIRVIDCSTAFFFVDTRKRRMPIHVPIVLMKLATINANA